MKIPSRIAAFAALGLVLIGNAFAADADGWIAMFNGKDLAGWRSNEETPGSFTIEDGAIKVGNGRAHLFFVGEDGKAKFRNFEFRAKVKTMPGANSGVYFATEFQDKGWPATGYEAQVNTSHGDPRKTGSLYAVKDVLNVAPSKDDEWFDYAICVEGRHIVIQVDGRTVVDWTEPEDWDPAKSLKNMPGRKLGDGGTIALQGHDPKSVVYYKDLSIKPLP